MEADWTAEVHAPSGALDLLTGGLRRALRYWPVLLIWYIASLLVALTGAIFPAMALWEAADSALITQIADGVDAWMLVDFVGMAASLQGADPASVALPDSLGYGIGALVWGFLLLPMLGAPVTAFLYGGALLTYHEAPVQFDWRRFWWGCRHWFWGMMGLAVVQFVLFLGLFLPLAAGSWYLSSMVGMWLAVILLALLLALWTVIFELARAQMIVQNTRNLFVGLGRAFGLIFKRPGLVFGVYVPSLLLLAVAHGVFRLGILPVVPFSVLIVALAAQQAFIILRLYLRAARLAAVAKI